MIHEVRCKSETFSIKALGLKYVLDHNIPTLDLCLLRLLLTTHAYVNFNL